jgi:hypothetical protein
MIGTSIKQCQNIFILISAKSTTLKLHDEIIKICNEARTPSTSM